MVTTESVAHVETVDEFAYIDRPPRRQPISQNRNTRKTARAKHRRWAREQCELLSTWIAAQDSRDVPFFDVNLDRLERLEQELRDAALRHEEHQRSLHPVPRTLADPSTVDPLDLVGLPNWKQRYILRHVDPESYRNGRKLNQQQRKQQETVERQKAEARVMELVTASPDSPPKLAGNTLMGLLSSRRNRGAA